MYPMHADDTIIIIKGANWSGVNGQENNHLNRPKLWFDQNLLKRRRNTLHPIHYHQSQNFSILIHSVSSERIDMP